MTETTPLERLFKRDRVITLTGLLTLCALSWLYILMGAGLGMSAWDMTSLVLFPGRHTLEAMPAMPGMSMGASDTDWAPWGFSTSALMVAMWWVMMVAMMTPSAAPTILLYAQVNRGARARRRSHGHGPTDAARFASPVAAESGSRDAARFASTGAVESGSKGAARSRPAGATESGLRGAAGPDSTDSAGSESTDAAQFGSTGAFAAGYLFVWLGFSVGAAALQWMLERTGLVSAMMMGSRSRWLSGGILIAAGLYQLSPLKNHCLAHCRSPAAFLSRYWRPRAFGALQLGIRHGAYCVGCCWMLMALLFVGGVMNLIWIAALAIVVLAEKLLPRGPWVSRCASFALTAWGFATFMV